MVAGVPGYMQVGRCHFVGGEVGNSGFSRAAALIGGSRDAPAGVTADNYLIAMVVGIV